MGWTGGVPEPWLTFLTLISRAYMCGSAAQVDDFVADSLDFGEEVRRSKRGVSGHTLFWVIRAPPPFK